MPFSLGKVVRTGWRSVKKRLSRKNRDSSRRTRGNEGSSQCTSSSRSSHKRDGDDDEDDDPNAPPDPLMWSKDLEKHFYGDFSFAMVQGNGEMEDFGQVETGANATFVGVYDGHGGTMVSHYVRDQLFRNLINSVQENRTMSEANLYNAFAATEEGFLSIVNASFENEPMTAAVGSCCLVGLIWNERLYVANIGDSRAVKGYLTRSNRISAEQLTSDHNARRKAIRRELRSSHPGDRSIVIKKQGMWRVKGLIQVSRAFGDAYLKKPEYALDARFVRFHLREPIKQPVLRADPSVYTRNLRPSDRFLIFASDGLWEHVSNQRAVEIVHKNPRAGIARRLLRAALNEAAKKGKTRYDDLKKLAKGVRRRYHDDITVVVIFIDNEWLEQKADVPPMSVLGGIDHMGESMFNILGGAILPNA